jgi:hypothetical protein
MFIYKPSDGLSPPSAALSPAEPAAAKIENRPLTKREALYASGNRRRDNLTPRVSDPRPRSRLYAKGRGG